MIKKGQWIVLHYDATKDHPNLQISPLGMVPQHNQRPQTIVDYTWSGINQDTIPLTPKESMQFGQIMQQLLQQLPWAHPQFGPIHMGKVDIANGFYRIDIQPSHTPKLTVALPTAKNTKLVAIPLCLPMGWVESPPYFCCITKTLAHANKTTNQPTLYPTTSSNNHYTRHQHHKVTPSKK